MEIRSIKQKLESAYHKSVQSGMLFYLAPAMYLCLLLIEKGFVKPSGYYRLHYLFTYDHGLVSRGLVGEVMSWFFDTITDQTIQYVVFGCCFVLIIGSSLCFGKALNTVKDNPKELLYTSIIAIIILVMPTSFSMQFESLTLDKFIWTVTVFSVFLTGTKIGAWLVPALCVISSFINPVYVFSSMILIAIVLLQKFYSSRFSFKWGFICFLAYAGIIVATLISVNSTHNTGFADTNEMLDFYYQRFIGESLTDSERKLFADEWLFEYFVSVKEVFFRTFSYYFKEWGFGIMVIEYLLVIIVPITTLLSVFWVRAIKGTENKFQKLIYFICLISPLIVIPETILGWEIPRYYSDILIVQLSLIIFFIANKNEAVTESIRDILCYFKKHPVLSLLTLLHFSLIIVL